jgi:Predicted membrane protein (DUF2306)
MTHRGAVCLVAPVRLRCVYPHVSAVVFYCFREASHRRNYGVWLFRCHNEPSETVALSYNPCQTSHAARKRRAQRLASGAIMSASRQTRSSDWFRAKHLVFAFIGLIFALNRMIPQHRQWMTRSYAVALTFLEIRCILGVTGLDAPPDPAIAEIVVWSCVAVAVLIGDLANQWYELQSAPRRQVRLRATSQTVTAGTAAE